MERRDRTQQSLVGWGLVVGISLAVFGGLGTFLFLTTSVHQATATRDPTTGAVRSMGDAIWAYVAFGIVIVGGLIVLASLLYGVWHDRTSSRGVGRRVENARIVARYALTPDGVLHTEDWAIVHLERVRFYIRLALPGEGAAEFEAARPVWDMAGEGMTGVAEIQGRWLGRFTPVFGAGAPGAGIVHRP